MSEIERRLDRIEGEITEVSADTNPYPLTRKLRAIASLTDFDLERQPVLWEYEQVLHNVEKDFKITQDIRLVRMYSLVHNLVWYNNVLKEYEDHSARNDPASSLIRNKNIYYNLCRLELLDLRFELSADLKKQFKRIIDLAYNSMVDSRDLNDIHSKDNAPTIKAHSTSVDVVNELFKNLGSAVNDELSQKFSDDQLDMFTSLKVSI